MITVVAALIKKDNKFLIAKRKDETAPGGYWEFPGGKVEAGESDEAALDEARADQKDQILADLTKYCKMDTWAMVEIYRKLKEL